MIPIKIDSEDRIRNFKMIRSYLSAHFDAEFIIYEADTESKLESEIPKDSRFKYVFKELKENEPFHRTKYLNEMIDMSSLDNVANYDTDVLVEPSVVQTIDEKLTHNQADFIYPYGFNEYDQIRYYINNPEYVLNKFEENPTFKTLMNDVNKDAWPDKPNQQDGIFGELTNQERKASAAAFDSWMTAAGHCVFARKQAYIDGFMENEKFISWGPEDQERRYRFLQLGMRVVHASGNKIIHLEHNRDSGDTHYHNPQYDNNQEEWAKINGRSKDEILGYYLHHCDYYRNYKCFNDSYWVAQEEGSVKVQQ